MGTGEESTPAKPSKPAATSTQEVQSAPAYPEWPGSMQVYYGAGATPTFFPSSVASPHPYVYQHPFVPHYGTPVPYPAIYPAGGVYPHPNMAMAPSAVASSGETEGKAANGKDQASGKKAKLTTPVSKVAESGKAASGSGDGGSQRSVPEFISNSIHEFLPSPVADIDGDNTHGHSGDSGSEGSTDGSDDQQEYTAASKKGSFNQMLADANAQNNNAAPNAHGAVSVASVPATNLNIGMDLWNAPPAAAAALGTAKMRSNPTGGSSSGPDQWLQDEREIKRQKRKQSNRESARRSRLRKQAECEELQHRVQNLTNDNHNLKNELLRVSEECEKLKSENESIKKKLKESYGQEAADQLEQNNLTSRGDEGNS